MHPHPLSAGGGGEGVGGGLNLLPNFQKKKGLGRTSIFRGGLLGKRGVTFFREGCHFSTKNKLKSGIFND